MEKSTYSENFKVSLKNCGFGGPIATFFWDTLYLTILTGFFNNSTEKWKTCSSMRSKFKYVHRNFFYITRKCMFLTNFGQLIPNFIFIFYVRSKICSFASLAVFLMKQNLETALSRLRYSAKCQIHATRTVGTDLYICPHIFVRLYMCFCIPPLTKRKTIGT